MWCVMCEIKVMWFVISDVWARLRTWEVSQRKFARFFKTMCFEPFPCTQADVAVEISESSETNPTKHIAVVFDPVWLLLDIWLVFVPWVCLARICPCSSMKKQMNWNESMNCPGIRGRTPGKPIKIIEVTLEKILGKFLEFPRNHHP